MKNTKPPKMMYLTFDTCDDVLYTSAYPKLDEVPEEEADQIGVYELVRTIKLRVSREYLEVK
jgi:hypothetical protein